MQSVLNIKINGSSLNFCPSFDDLCAIEKILSISMLELAKKLADGQITLHELMVVFENSIEPQARNMDYKTMILQYGMTDFIQLITSLFLVIFKGNEGQAINRGELEIMMDTFGN